MKVYYTSKNVFRVDGKHVCAFDHELEYRKRVKYMLAIDMMSQNPLARNRDVLAAVKCQMPITLCEEKALIQFVSSRTTANYGKVQKDLASLVIPDCLKVVGTSLDHGDKTFLIFDSFDEDRECDRVLIFSSHGMRQRAATAIEIFADGTYRTASNTIATLYTVHTVIGGVSFPIFFMMLPNERETTFERAFLVIRRFMNAFSETSVAHVDCQLAAINALRTVFGCRIRICLFHQNQAVWRAVARFGLAGAYNNREFPKLHLWVRRLFALPFLTDEVILSNFSLLFERDAINGEIHVEGSCIEAFEKLVHYYKSFWLQKIGVNMWCNNVGQDRTNNRCEGFHNGLRQAIPLAHPNPYILIELLRKTEKESSERFGQYLRGEDVCQSTKKRKVFEERITKALERYRSLNTVITPRQFLDQVAIAYMDFYNDEKLTREKGTLEAARPFGKVDAVRDILNQQSVCDDCRMIESEFVEMNETTEIFFNSIIEESTRAELEHICTVEKVTGNEVESPVDLNAQPCSPRSTKKTIESKPKRKARKKSFLGKLEDARKRARRGLPV